MTLHPAPLDLVVTGGNQRVKLLPQIDIFYRRLCSRTPAPCFPAVHPFGDAFANIFAVKIKRHMTGLVQCSQRLDDSGHFHAVIGGSQFAAKQFFLGIALNQQGPPTAGSRVSFAGSVCVDDDCLLKCSACRWLAHVCS